MTATIRLYKIDKDKQLREGFGMSGRLPKYRLEKLSKLKNEKAKWQSYFAGRLLVYILAEEYAMSDEEAVRLLDSEKHCLEKRTIAISEDTKDNIVHYNISHSGDIVSVAMSQAPVGIDIEHKDDRDFKVTSRMFSEEDKAFINADQKKFREVWTSKESFLKCTGEGIVVPLNSFTLDFEKNETVDFRGDYIFVRREIKPLGYDLRGKNFFVYTKYNEEENFCFSICSENKNLLLDIKWVEVLS